MLTSVLPFLCRPVAWSSYRKRWPEAPQSPSTTTAWWVQLWSLAGKAHGASGMQTQAVASLLLAETTRRLCGGGNQLQGALYLRCTTLVNLNPFTSVPAGEDARAWGRWSAESANQLRANRHTDHGARHLRPWQLPRGELMHAVPSSWCISRGTGCVILCREL